MPTDAATLRRIEELTRVAAVAAVRTPSDAARAIKSALLELADFMQDATTVENFALGIRQAMHEFPEGAPEEKTWQAPSNAPQVCGQVPDIGDEVAHEHYSRNFFDRDERTGRPV